MQEMLDFGTQPKQITPTPEDFWFQDDSNSHAEQYKVLLAQLQNLKFFDKEILEAYLKRTDIPMYNRALANASLALLLRIKAPQSEDEIKLAIYRAVVCCLNDPFAFNILVTVIAKSLRHPKLYSRTHQRTAFLLSALKVSLNIPDPNIIEALGQAEFAFETLGLQRIFIENVCETVMTRGWFEKVCDHVYSSNFLLDLCERNVKKLEKNECEQLLKNLLGKFKSILKSLNHKQDEYTSSKTLTLLSSILKLISKVALNIEEVPALDAIKNLTKIVMDKLAQNQTFPSQDREHGFSVIIQYMALVIGNLATNLSQEKITQIKKDYLIYINNHNCKLLDLLFAVAVLSQDIFSIYKDLDNSHIKRLAEILFDDKYMRFFLLNDTIVKIFAQLIIKATDTDKQKLKKFLSDSPLQASPANLIKIDIITKIINSIQDASKSQCLVSVYRLLESIKLLNKRDLLESDNAIFNIRSTLSPDDLGMMIELSKVSYDTDWLPYNLVNAHPETIQTLIECAIKSKQKNKDYAIEIYIRSLSLIDNNTEEVIKNDFLQLMKRVAFDALADDIFTLQAVLDKLKDESLSPSDTIYYLVTLQTHLQSKRIQCDTPELAEIIKILTRLIDSSTLLAYIAANTLGQMTHVISANNYIEPLLADLKENFQATKTDRQKHPGSLGWAFSQLTPALTIEQMSNVIEKCRPDYFPLLKDMLTTMLDASDNINDIPLANPVTPSVSILYFSEDFDNKSACKKAFEDGIDAIKHPSKHERFVHRVFSYTPVSGKFNEAKKHSKIFYHYLVCQTLLAKLYNLDKSVFAKFQELVLVNNMSLVKYCILTNDPDYIFSVAKYYNENSESPFSENDHYELYEAAKKLFESQKPTDWQKKVANCDQMLERVDISCTSNISP